MRSLVIIVLLHLLAGSASGQEGRWTAHTSQRQIVDLSSAGDAIWAATTGGVFRYTIGAAELTSYTASDGMHSVQSQAIAYDPVREVVWIGYLDGVLDRLDPATGTIQSFRDIARADRFTSREINRIVVHGDSVLVATSFGLVVFDPIKEEVRDTYSQLGSIAPGTGVYDLTFAPGPSGTQTLWLATNDGVAFAPTNAVNLQDPAVWTVEAESLPTGETRAVAYFAGKIYVGTTGDLLRRDGPETYFSMGISGQGVHDLLPLSDRLLAVTRFDPFVVTADGVRARIDIEGYQDPVGLVRGPDGNVWIGDSQGGLIAIQPPAVTDSGAEIVVQEVYPAGPYDNLFTRLEIDAEGNLWASGIADGEAGFYRFSTEGEWTNYIPRLVPGLEGRGSFERIYVDDRGHAWAGSSGNALVEVTSDGEVRRWHAGNSTLGPATGTADYIIVGGISSDADERVWVTNIGSAVPLHVYEPDGEWTGIPRVDCDGFSTSSLTFDRIYIDSFGQKWIIVLDLANLRRVMGLLVLETGSTPTNTDDDACNFLSAEGSGGQGLPGTTVTSVVEDSDGLVWIGTDRGLAFMINSGIVARDQTTLPIWPQFADRSLGTFVLNGVGINDLAVDPANRLWVATDEGAYVVEQVEGGYQIAEQFTSRNSPLFSDAVVAVAVDPGTGMVYLATDEGLISYESDAIAGAEQPRDLKVYPNPALVADGETSIYIEGLVEATELRIVTLAGEVVWSTRTRGGRARWDGRGLDDQLVPSGMYLVVAVGENGEGAAYGKVAVIR